MSDVFKDNLNYYLYTNGFSQAEMARRMHVSTATAARWCTGENMPKYDRIEKLARWFGVEPEDLLKPRAEKKPERKISDEEYDIVVAYRKAPDAIKGAICDILHIRKDAGSSSSRKEA